MSDDKKIILISPKREMETIHTYPSIALCLIATILENNGYSVEIFDGYTDRDYVAKSLDAVNSNTIYVGLTVMTSEIAEAKRISFEIKNKNKTVPVVWGGNHPSLYPISVMKENYVDYVVFNEGAFTSLELANNIFEKTNAFSKIKGLYYKQDGKIKNTGFKNLEDEHPERYPFINYDFVDINEYCENNIFTKALSQSDYKKHKSICILTGMGCSYKCRFCINPCLNRYYREISAKKIYLLMKYYQSKYDADSFIFIDDNFSSNQNKIEQLCDLLERGNDRFYWLRVCTRANYFGKEKINKRLMERMVDNGARYLQIGLESGSERIREGFYKKGITLKQLIYSAKITRNLTVGVKYTSIIGAPDETLSDVFKTFYILMKLFTINKNVTFSVFNLVPQPGTELFEELIPHTVINRNSSVDEWIKCLKHPDYYVNNYVQNKIEPQKFQICNFYFTLFFWISDIKKSIYLSRRLPRLSFFLSRAPLNICIKLFRLMILLRFKIGTTRLPLAYWTAKHILRYPVDKLQLARETGLNIEKVTI